MNSISDGVSGYEAYKLFNAIKLHFTTDSYSFFKYNGKTNVTKEQFAVRKDKYSFYKLSRKYSIADLKNFFIANFIVKDFSWVGEIANEEGEDNYRKWQKRNQSLTYVFQQDILHLMDSVNTPDDLLKVKFGQHPNLLIQTMQGEIAIETLVILNDIMNFFPMWNKKISDDIVWPTYKRKCEKYSPFLFYDKSKFKSILKENLHEKV